MAANRMLSFHLEPLRAFGRIWMEQADCRCGPTLTNQSLVLGRNFDAGGSVASPNYLYSRTFQPYQLGSERKCRIFFPYYVS